MAKIPQKRDSQLQQLELCANKHHKSHSLRSKRASYPRKNAQIRHELDRKIDKRSPLMPCSSAWEAGLFITDANADALEERPSVTRGDLQ